MRHVAFTFALATLLLAGNSPHAFASEPNPALAQVIESRSEQDRARDAARHPLETLTFFQVEPGMTVAEALPGGGWYTRILANYLGSQGTLYGVNYVDRMWSMFSFATEEFIKGQLAASSKFPAMVASFTDNGIKAKGFTFNTVPPEASGTVDRVLMIRALHNLNRFEAAAGTRSQALASVRGMLKDDGMVGVVQHRLPESQPDAGADGSRGYLKQSAVITMFEEAGFELWPAGKSTPMTRTSPGWKTLSGAYPPHCG